MANNRPPKVRDDALYSATLETLRLAPEPLTMRQLRDHKNLAAKLTGQRIGRINDVINCLHVKHQIQLGRDDEGVLIATSIDKPAPPNVILPGQKQKASGTKPGVKKTLANGLRRRVQSELYDATLQLINSAPSFVTMHEIRTNPTIAQMLVGQRTGRMNEVLNGLRESKQIQFGYDAEQYIVVAAIGKDFPFAKNLPKGKRTRFQKLGAADLAAVIAAAAQSKATEQEETPKPETVIAQTAPQVALSLDSIVQQFAETLGAQLGKALAQTFSKSFIETALLNLPPQFASVVAAPSAVKVPEHVRPKAIIAGLLPEQAGLINHEYGDRLNFAFVESKEVSNSKRVDALVASHDVAFAMTGFINHSLYNKLRGAKEFRHVKGGMSTLRDELNTYIAKNMPPPHLNGQQQPATHH